MSGQEKDLAKIALPTQDPSSEKSLEERKQDDAARQVDLLKKEPDDKEEDADMSEEDRKLKAALDLLVAKTLEVAETKDQEQIQKNALEGLRTEIRTSTSSMTSVPKPLKFLRPHYEALKTCFAVMSSANKPSLADILSVLAMTTSSPDDRESLKFRLVGTTDPVGSWGHEYVRNLSGEIGKEFAARQEKEESVDDLIALVDEIVPFNAKHNAEFEAVDLLLEVERLPEILKVLNKDNHLRVCGYIIACAEYMPEDQEEMLGIAFDAYAANDSLPDALRVAIRMGNKERMLRCFSAATDKAVRYQLGFILGSCKVVLEELKDDDELMEVAGNVKLNGYYLHLAKELDVLDPKTPDDIYKDHLVENKGRKAPRPDSKDKPAAATNAGVESAKQNLASTFVNAFVNCGFGNGRGDEWLYKNKAHGMLSAAGGLGMIHLWDVDLGFTAVDKYSSSSQSPIKAGVLLATGIISSGVTSEMDAALALLSDHAKSTNKEMQVAAVLGLGLAYAGTARADVLEILVGLINDNSETMEVVSLTCLALGLVFCGTGNDDVSGSILEAFFFRTEADLKDSAVRMMCLGLGLLFLGLGDKTEVVISAIKAIDNPIKKYLELTVETCAYVGTCSVLEIQKLLSVLSEHIPDDEKEPQKGMHQEVAVLGVAMVAMGEGLGASLALRSLDHILQYGEVNVRRVIPLALGLLSVSNPQLTVMETLSKLTHDSDEQISQNAIFSLGLLGAGTNNARIANALRQLSSYYSKDPNHLYLVRIAQGLLHMGKGLLSLNPFHSDNLLMNKVSVAGLLTVLHSGLDMKNSLLPSAKRHFLLYSLVCSVRPRMLITLDEDLKPIQVSVRIGQKVDVVGQAGKPRTITGFQQHNTPVLLAHGERAELSNDEYIPLTSVLEGFVIVKKNPNFIKEEE